MNESSSVEELRDPGQPASVRVEALPAFLGAGNPAVAPRSYDRETLPDDLRKTATVRGAVEALREAVDRSDVAGRQEAAAAAWHAEPVVRPAGDGPRTSAARDVAAAGTIGDACRRLSAQRVRPEG